jgi:hypothetical protein
VNTALEVCIVAADNFAVEVVPPFDPEVFRFYHFLCKAFSEPALAEAQTPIFYPGRKGNLIDIDRSIDAVDLDRGGHIECSIPRSGR